MSRALHAAITTIIIRSSIVATPNKVHDDIVILAIVSCSL